jgi:ubiquitin-like modifier-activating enzyme ATG7
MDPSALPDNPGWPLRNLLAYLRALYPSSTSVIRVLCWRDSEVPVTEKAWRSRFGVLELGGGVVGATRPSAVGWEKNTQGKLGPRMADLAPMMDPTRYVIYHSFVSLIEHSSFAGSRVKQST